MAKIARVIALSIVALFAAHHATAIGSGTSPRHWSALAYSRMPALGQEAGWATDFGIVGGRCNASLVGAAVADADSARTPLVAMLHGPVLGGPPALDAADRGCMGHALELAPSYFAVRWTNPETRGRFTLTPMRRLDLHGKQCRLFSAQAVQDGDARIQRATACRLGYGEWYMI